MRFLITGGAGFIGSHLAERLLQRGDTVVLLDNLSTGSMDNIRHLKSFERMEYHLDNIENRQLVAELVGDADAVIELETAMAQAQMDNVKRRDPKNINNKMSLAQVRELTPSIDWELYLKTVKAPASDHYIVTSPDFFRAEEKLRAEIDRPLPRPRREDRCVPVEPELLLV